MWPPLCRTPRGEQGSLGPEGRARLAAKPARKKTELAHGAEGSF